MVDDRRALEELRALASEVLLVCPHLAGWSHTLSTRIRGGLMASCRMLRSCLCLTHESFVQARHTLPEVRLWLITTLTQLAGKAPESTVRAKLLDIVAFELKDTSRSGAATGCCQQLLALYVEEEPKQVCFEREAERELLFLFLLSLAHLT